MAKQLVRRADGSAYSSNPSERARQLYEDGKFGGAGRGQGQKRKPRLHELVADRADSMAADVMKAFADSLDESQPARLRLDAARRLTELSADYAAREEQRLRFEQFQEIEDRAFAKLSADAQSALLAQKLGELGDDQAQKLLAEAVEGSAEEISDADVIEEMQL